MIRTHTERYFHWHGCSTVTGIILQQSLARLFTSHWHDYSKVAGTIVQPSLALLFNSGWHDRSTVTGKIFSFFYSGRILQHGCSLLKDCAMYQEYDTWSEFSSYFSVKFENFLKSRLIFNIFYCFWMFVRNFSNISSADKKCLNVKSWTYIIFIWRQRHCQFSNLH